VVNGVTN